MVFPNHSVVRKWQKNPAKSYICTSRWLQHIYVDIVIYLLMLTYINIDVFVYNVRICIISYKSKIFKCMNPIAFYLIHNFIFNKSLIDGNILTKILQKHLVVHHKIYVF